MWIWIQPTALRSQVALLRTWLRLTRGFTLKAATPSPATTGALEPLEPEVELEARPVAGAAGSTGSAEGQGETKAMTATGAN